MANTNISFAGVNELISALNLKRSEVRDAAAEAMKVTVAEAQAKAKEIAPKRTGVMAGNINVMPVSKGLLSIKGTFIAEVNYSSYVEFGTRKMAAEPFMRPAVSWAISRFTNTTVNKMKEAAKFK